MRTFAGRLGTLALLGGVALGFVAPPSGAQLPPPVPIPPPGEEPPEDPIADRPPETQTGASIARVGWWNRANDAPSLPTGNPPPPPTSVQEGELAVGAFGGDTDKVAAVSVTPDATSGPSGPTERDTRTVSAFTLTLHEVTGPGTANSDGEGVSVVACPITNFWTGAENGRWESRPEAACDGGEVPGTRADDGTWTWDLTSIGQQWLEGSLAPNGVLFTPKVDPPVSFQIAFDGATEQIGVTFVTTDSGATTPTRGASSSGSFGTGGTTSPGGGFSASPSGGFGGGSFTTPPATQPPTPRAPSGQAGGSRVPQMIRDAEHPSVFANLPGATLVLVPLVVGVAVLVMLTLGRAGEPSLAARQGRVSRVLALRLHQES